MNKLLKIAFACAIAATTAFAANGIHLPVYQYAGNDAVKAALTDYVMSEFTPLEDDPDVTIPVVNVIAMDYSKDGETLVWGSFSVYNYELHGDTLVSISGGEYPGFARLKRTADGYEVDSFEVIGEKTKNSTAVKKALGKHYNTFKKVEGDVALREKIRTKKRVIRETVKKMEQFAENGRAYDGKCYISQSNCYEDARKVADLVEAAFPKMNGKVEINWVGTTIGAHTGPGTIALFFIGDPRDKDPESASPKEK